ncbi:MAG TPA: methyltransferase domain-containing protein [Pseudobdellovibrionaceae bacterium]|nr:methyltransferase domain-containing protein [Pseudobdellovibrionaceae bacterium]
MANETSKTKKIWTEKEWSYLQGEGIDIGCGDDPVLPSAQASDQIHGDANQISRFVQKQYDYVFSSHCLEHMSDPILALREWYSIVKPGGVLFVIVPDEDLYEQGNFPSRFNGDHKWTFTLSKRESWSEKSVNVLNLVQGLGGEILNLELQDRGFDYRIYRHDGGWWAYRLWRWFKKIPKFLKGTWFEIFMSRIFHIFGSGFDQTWMGGDRLAQIQLIVRKPK